MPHYYFDIKNGHRLIDPAGLDCSDDDDAIAKAKLIATQISQDAPKQAGQRHIAILNSDRAEVFKIPVYEDAASR
jgi:hypothetical protein